MLEAAIQAVSYTNGRKREDLDADHMMRRALIHAIQEIGEAAVRLSPATKARITDIPWVDVIRMRNILVHVYWGIDLDTVWNTAINDLPPLLDALRRSPISNTIDGELGGAARSEG